MITVRQLGYLAGSLGQRNVRLHGGGSDDASEGAVDLPSKPNCAYLDCKHLAVFGVRNPATGNAWVPLACSQHAPRSWMTRQPCSSRVCEISKCGTRVKDSAQWCGPHRDMIAEIQATYPKEGMEAILYRLRGRDQDADLQRSKAFLVSSDYLQLRDRVAHKLSALTPEDMSTVPLTAAHTCVDTCVTSPHDAHMLALADARLRDMGHRAVGNQSGRWGRGLLQAVQDLLAALGAKRDPREEAARMLAGGERSRNKAVALVAAFRAQK